MVKDVLKQIGYLNRVRKFYHQNYAEYMVVFDNTRNELMSVIIDICNMVLDHPYM